MRWGTVIGFSFAYILSVASFEAAGGAKAALPATVLPSPATENAGTTDAAVASSASPSPSDTLAPLLPTNVKDAQPCVSIANCSLSCDNRLHNQRGESWHSGGGGSSSDAMHRQHQEHPLDVFDPCFLGCCLRTDAQYKECAGRCWYWARADQSATKLTQYDQFHRCAAGCDLRCRWNYAAIPPPNDGAAAFLSPSPSPALPPITPAGDPTLTEALLPPRERCPHRHFSKVQALFVRAPDLEKLEQQRLTAQLLTGAGNKGSGLLRGRE